MIKKNIKTLLGILLIFLLGISSPKLSNKYNTIIQSNNSEFKEHVVFYPQHQDDEVLWGVSAITKAIEQCGAENVYIVLVSDGSGVNVFMRNPRFLGMSRKEKENLRNNEFKAALHKLGVKEENILILADIDEKAGTHYELMEKTILKFEHDLKNVTHIAHHYKYDDHIMHRKNGMILKKLSDNHKIKDARYYLKPKYVKYIPKEKRNYYSSETAEEKKKAKESLDQYKLIDEEKHRFGIGYISSPSYFDHLYDDSNYTSVLSTY